MQKDACFGGTSSCDAPQPIGEFAASPADSQLGRSHRLYCGAGNDDYGIDDADVRSAFTVTGLPWQISPLTASTHMGSSGAVWKRGAMHGSDVRWTCKRAVCQKFSKYSLSHKTTQLRSRFTQLHSVLQATCLTAKRARLSPSSLHQLQLFLDSAQTTLPLCIVKHYLHLLRRCSRSSNGDRDFRFWRGLGTGARKISCQRAVFPCQGSEIDRIRRLREQSQSALGLPHRLARRQGLSLI